MIRRLLLLGLLDLLELVLNHAKTRDEQMLTMIVGVSKVLEKVVETQETTADAVSRMDNGLASVAAPKPLSMLTTDTPAAQLFSMPSRAANPPKLAP